MRLVYKQCIFLHQKELLDVYHLFTHRKCWSEISGGADKEAFAVPSEYEYILFYNGNELSCMFYFRPWNKQVLESHIIIHPDYRHPARKKKLMDKFHQWAKEKDYLHIVCQVPADRHSVIKFVTNHDYKACGIIENGISWNNQLMPLLLFTHQL